MKRHYVCPNCGDEDRIEIYKPETDDVVASWEVEGGKLVGYPPRSLWSLELGVRYPNATRWLPPKPTMYRCRTCQGVFKQPIPRSAATQTTHKLWLSARRRG